jgi:hypothetical protein
MNMTLAAAILLEKVRGCAVVGWSELQTANATQIW